MEIVNAFPLSDDALKKIYEVEHTAGQRKYGEKAMVVTVIRQHNTMYHVKIASMRLAEVIAILMESFDHSKWELISAVELVVTEEVLTFLKLKFE